MIGKIIVWRNVEYRIIDIHDESDFVMINDENMSIIGLHWENVYLKDERSNCN